MHRGGRFGLRAALALGAALYALGAACGGGGGGGGGGTAAPRFSARLLPLQIPGTSGGAGDVAFAGNGDALVVGGGTDTIFRISRTDGSLAEEAANVAGGTPLRSVVADPTVAVLYAGDEDGTIHAVDDMGSTPLATVPGAGAVDGLVFAPSGYDPFAGQLVAATEAGGIVAVDPETGAVTAVTGPAPPVWSDLAFLGGTLYAVDFSGARIVTVAADGTVETFVDADLASPDGLAADAVNGQLLVADSGETPGVLKSVSVPTEEDEDPVVTALGAFGFEPGSAPSGLAFDGVGSLLLPTSNDMLVVRGAGIPGFPAFPTFGIGGTDNGFGSLTLDLDGNAVGTANGPGQNRIFRVRRSDGLVTTVASDVGDAANDEALLGIALDPATGTLYVGTSAGRVFAVNAGGVSPFAVLPTPALDADEAVTALAIAPGAFDPGGPLAGDLVVATGAPNAGDILVGGGLYTIDLASPTAVLLADPPGDGDLTGLAFAADGTLYVLDNEAGVVTVDAQGTVSAPIGTDLVAPDGLAIDEGGGRLLVADPGTNDGPVAQLRAVSLPAGDVSNLAPAAFQVGFFPSGVAFDGLSSALLLTGDQAASFQVVPVFPPDEEP